MPLIADTLKLARTIVRGRNESTACKDFTALGGDGLAGYFKMAYGAAPVAHAEPGFAQLWVDNDGALLVLKGNGTDMKVAMDEDEE